MAIKYILFLFCLWSPGLAAQSFTVSGHIRDAATGEDMIGANVYIANLDIGTSTNNYGFYSITVTATDSISIIYTYLGFEPQIKKAVLDKNMTVNISMVVQGESLEEVVVSSRANNEDNVQRTQMGVIDVPVRLVRALPAILGEVDVLKIIQLLPGVQAGQEGTTGFYVRGGNADQNLVMLDEATVYNPNHLFGLVSTFNSRALNNIKLTKGGFPANYGGRLSSILEISMKEGNNQHMEVQGGLGLISSNLSVEGPIVKDRASFIVSGRRSYLDLLARPFLPKGNQTNYYLHDFNAKVNYKITERDRIYLSYFTGRDKARYNANSLNYGIRFGNGTTTLRWNHIFGQKLFLNTSLIQNDYLLSLWSVQGNYFEQYYSGIKDLGGKMEFQYYPNPRHYIKFGGGYTYHQFTSTGKENNIPNNVQPTEIQPASVAPRYNSEVAFYIDDEYHLTPKIAVDIGLRLPFFMSADTSYQRIEPRLSVKFNISQSSSLKASYTIMNQFVHLIPSSTASLPTDIWTPSSRVTKPQLAEQLALGYFRNFNENEYEASAEVYYKKMDNQALFREGTQLSTAMLIDDFLVFGKGWSYGAEFFLKRNRGKLSGWISYTLSWTNQQFADLNFGQRFPFKFDRRHLLSATGIYKLNDKWTVSAIFVYSSGVAYTLPTSRVTAVNAGSIFEGSYFVYEGKNNTRLNPYHRLDLSVSRKKKGSLFKKPFESEWVLGIYNTYSRRNPYFVYFTIDPIGNLPKAKQVSLLPILPSITYNFKI